MRFGNAPAMHGRAACRKAWADFCALADGVRHEVVNQWDVGDTTIAETNVTYTRKDGKVFIDLAPVFAAEPPR